MRFREGNLLTDIPICDAPEVVDLFVFSWVLTESSAGLQDTGFHPLRTLFSRAALGVVFAFLDCTDRLWPAVLDAARAEGTFEAIFVNNSHKTSMILQRVSAVCPVRAEREVAMLQHCKAHASAHDSWTSRVCKDASTQQEDSDALSECDAEFMLHIE